MMIELLLVAIIVIYIFIVNGKINKDSMFGTNSKLCNLLKWMVKLLLPLTKAIGKFEKKVKNSTMKELCFSLEQEAGHFLKG